MTRVQAATADPRRVDRPAGDPVATAQPDRWWQLAACVGHDPEWWSDDSGRRAQAVEICISCPVRGRCLADAVDRRDVGVVRGGALLSPARDGHGHIVASLICGKCGARPIPVNHPTKRTRRACRPCRRPPSGRKDGGL